VVEGGGVAEEVENGATRQGSTLSQEAGDEASDGQKDEHGIGTEEGAASGGKREEILSHATVTPEDDHPPPSIGNESGGVVQQTTGGSASMPEEVGKDAGLESESVVEAKVEVEELGSDGRAQSDRMAKEGKPNEEGALTNRSGGTHADDGIISTAAADEASGEAVNEVALPYHVFHCELPGKCGFRGSLEEVAEHQKEHCRNRERPLVNRDKWSCVALDLSINRLRSLDPLVNHEGPPTGLTLPISGSILALDISANLISSLNGLELPNLRVLVVADCCLADLNGIEACPRLQVLDASGNSITSIEHLAESGLTDLNTLKLHSNDIENLQALDNAPFMTTLTHLDLNHNEITSLTPLGGYATLAFLDVASNKLRDLFSLGGTISMLRGLTELNLMGNGFVAEDGRPLSGQAVRVMVISKSRGLVSKGSTPLITPNSSVAAASHSSRLITRRCALVPRPFPCCALLPHPQELLDMQHITQFTRNQIEAATHEVATKEFVKRTANAYAARIDEERMVLEQMTRVLRNQMNQAVGEFQEFSTSMKEEMEVVVAKADKRMRPGDLSPRMSAADYDEHIVNSLRSL